MIVLKSCIPSLSAHTCRWHDGDTDAGWGGTASPAHGIAFAAILAQASCNNLLNDNRVWWASKQPLARSLVAGGSL